MPITKQSIKQVRQIKKRTTRNEHFKSHMKSMIKLFLGYIASNELEKAKKVFPEVTSAIDTAVKKHLIHKNNAANKKSRLQKKLGSPAKKA